MLISRLTVKTVYAVYPATIPFFLIKIIEYDELMPLKNLLNAAL